MTRSNTFRGLSVAVVAVALLSTATATGAAKQERQSRGVTNIVLVHGAWADGSSWSKVIPLLQARGFNVVAVQTATHVAGRRRRHREESPRTGRWSGAACRSLVRRSRHYSSWERSQGRRSGLRCRDRTARGPVGLRSCERVSHAGPSGAPGGSIRIPEAHADRNSGGLRPGFVRRRADRACRHSGSNCRWRCPECAGFCSRLAEQAVLVCHRRP